MLAQERYEIILTMLQQHKIVKVAKLCELFSISIETVRRDLEYLESIGKLQRIYGGAMLKIPTSHEPMYHTREDKNKQEKQRIGAATAALIEDHETIILDLGTTTLEVSRHLKDKQDLTILTNHLEIAQELVDVESFRVIVIGGQLRRHELSMSGYMAESFINEFNVDKAVIGVGGITLDQGISDYHLEEARIRQHMLKRADKVIAVADHSKFDVKALVNVCPIQQLDILVTDVEPEQKFVRTLKDKKVKLVIAP